jgi:LPS sulfotransferase NodH
MQLIMRLPLWQRMTSTTLETDMNIRKNAKATAFYAAAETATLIADFALDMLAAAHRTGMDTMTLTYETLRANTIARIIEASDAMDIIGKPEAKDAYLARYNNNVGTSWPSLEALAS